MYYTATHEALLHSSVCPVLWSCGGTLTCAPAFRLGWCALSSPSLRLRLAQTWCDEEQTVKDINTDTIFTTDTPLTALLEGVAGTECEGVTEGSYFIAEYTFSHTHFGIFLLLLLLTYLSSSLLPFLHGTRSQIRVQYHTVDQCVDAPVPQIQVNIVQVFQPIPPEHISERLVIRVADCSRSRRIEQFIEP